MHSLKLAATAALLTSFRLVSAESYDFTNGLLSGFTNTGTGSVTTNPSNGAAFTITEVGDSPSIASTGIAPFTYGTVTCIMKSIGTAGIVSSFILQSTAKDELDFEFLGGPKGADTVQTNWFGKGVTVNGANEHDITGVAADQDFHTYTMNWSAEQTTFIVDGDSSKSWTITAAQVAQAGQSYPNTPMTIKLGAWIGCRSQSCWDVGGPANCGDDPNVGQGTCQWLGSAYAGGQGTMYVKSVSVTG